MRAILEKEALNGKVIAINATAQGEEQSRNGIPRHRSLSATAYRAWPCPALYP